MVAAFPRLPLDRPPDLSGQVLGIVLGIVLVVLGAGGSAGGPWGPRLEHVWCLPGEEKAPL